ncbi:glycosyltransferase family 2 protein [Erythrobacter sp. 3-20A1M]|uniref:glycosyltransferase family 2 protein n=1 Tax=Erythrobacter sp. 3-20A1M TaxID=2653850 RepID=UPI001BFC6400|nr:glycosyltransferase family 2 protein [Erythrobacter sp. 3-20A1M]
MVSSTRDPGMAVILVNYRGAHDTIECLASLFSGDTIPYVIVADNASGDGSVDRITAWADGEGSVPVANPAHANEAYDRIERPIAYEVLGPDELQEGVRKPLTVIETGGNLGFAGGNNRGLELALNNPEIDILWLLNNDTIVEADTVRKLREAFVSAPQHAMLGTPIRLYHDRDRHQLLNGMRFDKWTGAAAGIGGGSPIDGPFDRDAVIAQSDFVCGASLAVTRDFVEDVGLLEERFFLYYEEIDWAMRARGRHQTGFADQAVVYHKEGASAGSASRLSRRARSPLSEYHHIRSKMIFCRKHFPALLPLYFAQNLAILARRVARRQPAQARAVLRATFGLPLD